MNRRIAQDVVIGETLPLFEGLPPRVERPQTHTEEAVGAHQRTAVGGRRQAGARIDSRPANPMAPAWSSLTASAPAHRELSADRLAAADRHMRVAWQLSKALKAVKSGRKAGKKIARLTATQRHQVGNAICEHLLASLRQQVRSEQDPSKR